MFEYSSPADSWLHVISHCLTCCLLLRLTSLFCTVDIICWFFSLLLVVLDLACSTYFHSLQCSLLYWGNNEDNITKHPTAVFAGQQWARVRNDTYVEGDSHKESQNSFSWKRPLRAYVQPCSNSPKAGAKLLLCLFTWQTRTEAFTFHVLHSLFLFICQLTFVCFMKRCSATESMPPWEQHLFVQPPSMA